MESVLKLVYDNVFKYGVNLVYGRPGVGKSRLAYSIAETYECNSLLVIPQDTTDVENVHPGVIISDIEDARTLIRVASTTESKVVIVDTISRYEKVDLCKHAGKLSRMGERERTKFIFMAQVRVNPSVKSTYMHNVASILESFASERIEMTKVSVSRSTVETLLTCKVSGKRIVLPIRRNGQMEDKDLIKYITGSEYNIVDAIVRIQDTLGIVKEEKSKNKILRW